jgi:MFS family permease
MLMVSASSFTLCCFLNDDNSYLFYVVCVISGFGLGGELVILPATAADIVSTKNDLSNTFFGIWASCGKVSLALASGIFLPLVSLSDNFLIATSRQNKLTFMYAVVPLLLKCVTIVFLSRRLALNNELSSYEQK